jgi:hypothetical protein
LFIHKPIVIIEVQNEEIGNKVEAIFLGGNYRYIGINEGEGYETVVTLGRNSYDNYLICPSSKLNRFNRARYLAGI